jgi:hypothetical protein
VNYITRRFNQKLNQKSWCLNMEHSFFLVFSVLDPQGIIIQSRELLCIYFQFLGHAGQQSFQRLELDEEYLESVLSLVNCNILRS